MKRLRLILLILTAVVVPHLTFAQSNKLNIEGIRALQSDLSASVYSRNDIAGKACALVKVAFTQPGAEFEGNVIGTTEYKAGEYWVYITAGSKYLKMKHADYTPLMIRFDETTVGPVKSKNVYGVKVAGSALSSVSGGEAEFRIAHQNYDNNEYEIAVTWLEKAAKKGHPIAPNDLAILYQHGIGVPVNWTAAQEYYRQCGNDFGASSYYRILNIYINQYHFDEHEYLKMMTGSLPTIFFELDESEIRRDDKLILKYVANKIRSNPNSVYLIHAYQPNITGTEAINQRILQQRAKNVYNYLVSCGVPPAQLSIQSQMAGGIDVNEAALYSAVMIERM